MVDFADVDLPNLDKHIVEMPVDLRRDLAEMGRRNLFFFDKAILGYKDMTDGAHGALCTFLDHNGVRFKLILMPRDHYKTSVVTIGGGLQTAIKNPNERILIANESSTNAERFLRAIRTHCESNRIFRALYSQVIPKDFRKVRWNDSELDFVRQEVFPEPTFDTIGMGGAFVSRHYSHMIFDDLISEEAVKSEKVMKDTINRMNGILALLTKPELDTFWVVGTRWALHDIYSDIIKKYGKKIAKFIRAAIEDGEPIFPELMTLETLALKRQIMGEYKFSCLMMNNPRNQELQDLNVDDLKFHGVSSDGEHVTLYDREGNVERVLRVDQLDITCIVDPASSEKTKDDRNAITVTGVSPWGEAIVLEAWGRRCSPLDVIEKMFEIKQRWAPRVYGIEDVAYQKVLKHFVRDEARRRGLYLNIVPVKPGGKNKSHIRGLQPIMATGRLYVDPTQHLLRQELADYPLGQYDDVADSLALHQQLWRGIMSPERWERYKKSEQALIKGTIGRDVEEVELRARAMMPKRPPLEADDEATPVVLGPAWIDYTGAH